MEPQITVSWPSRFRSGLTAKQCTAPSAVFWGDLHCFIASLLHCFNVPEGGWALAKCSNAAMKQCSNQATQGPVPFRCARLRVQLPGLPQEVLGPGGHGR